jgi:hypothetical protein
MRNEQPADELAGQRAAVKPKVAPVRYLWPEEGPLACQEPNADGKQARGWWCDSRWKADVEGMERDRRRGDAGAAEDAHACM